MVWQRLRKFWSRDKSCESSSWVKTVPRQWLLVMSSGMSWSKFQDSLLNLCRCVGWEKLRKFRNPDNSLKIILLGRMFEFPGMFHRKQIKGDFHYLWLYTIPEVIALPCGSLITLIVCLFPRQPVQRGRQSLFQGQLFIGYCDLVCLQIFRFSASFSRFFPVVIDEVDQGGSALYQKQPLLQRIRVQASIQLPKLNKDIWIYLKMFLCNTNRNNSNVVYLVREREEIYLSHT